MKATGSAITRRILGIGVATVTMVLTSGAIPAFAYRLDPDPTSTARSVPLQAVGGGRSWIIPLIVGGLVVVGAALIGTVRIHRTREIAAGA